MIVPKRQAPSKEERAAQADQLVECLKASIRDIIAFRNGDTAIDYSTAGVTNPQMELARWVRDNDTLRGTVIHRFPHVDWLDLYNEDDQVVLEVASFLLTIYG